MPGFALEMGRRLRHLRHLQSSRHGALSQGKRKTLKSETNFCSARAAEKELQTAPWSGASAITATTTAVCRVGSPQRRAAHYASRTGSSSE